MLMWGEGRYLTRLTFPGSHGPVQSAANAARALITTATDGIEAC